MDNCLQCSEPLKHVPGRKEKSFCNVNCRNKYFYARRKKQIEDARKLLIPLPDDCVQFKKVAILTKEGEIKPLLPAPPKKTKGNAAKELSNSTDLRKKAENEPLNAPPLPQNAKDEVAPFRKPRSLDELRKLMPPGLDTLERGIWMSTERQKYGI